MKAKLMLDERRAKKDGTYPVVIQVKNVDKIRLSTPYSSLSENWDRDGFGKKEKDYKRKNVVLTDMLNKVKRFIVTLEEDGKRMTDKNMREDLSSLINKQSNKKKEKFFIDYLDEFLEKKTNIGTRTVYQTTKNKLLNYDSKCTFDSMNKAWMEKFEQWMSATMKVNAYAIHLRNVRSVFNYAIDEELTTLYPFRKFKIKKEETRKRSLTVEQLAILRDYPCEKHQERYRDIFMLMFYLIGVNAVDLFNAKELVNGRLEYKRAKTGKLYSIKVEPEAMVIIEKYRGANHLLNILDEYANYKDFLHRMSIELKNIGEVKRVGLGGKKERTPLFPELSSYWARHSWATTAAELDIPKETISEALGHEIGSAVTSIYIKFDKKKVDVANRKVIDCLSNQKKEEE